MCVFVCSQQPVPEKLQIRVNRISMAAYEALHYDKDQLKEACESEPEPFSSLVSHIHLNRFCFRVRIEPNQN